MKYKLLAVIVVLLFFQCVVFARSEIAVSSAAATKARLYATYKGFGTLNDPMSNSALVVFDEALKSDFSFEWCEKYFDPSVKSILSAITGDLSNIMPVKNIAFSDLRINDLNVSFRFILRSKNDEFKQGAAVMTSKDNKILAVSFDKS